MIAPAAAGADAVAAPTDTSSCSRAQTRSAFGEFLSAFDRGHYARLDSLFAAPPDFQWFSSPAPGPRSGREARARDTLLSYFRARHRHHDRLRLLDFHFTGRTRHWSNFWFDLHRAAQGYRGGRWFAITGKGAAVCDGGAARFIVISLGGPIPFRHHA